MNVLLARSMKDGIYRCAAFNAALPLTLRCL